MNARLIEPAPTPTLAIEPDVVLEIVNSSGSEMRLFTALEVVSARTKMSDGMDLPLSADPPKKD